MPFIMRNKDDYQQLLGPTYVHGIMNGEVFDRLTQGDLNARRTIFSLC